MQQTPDVDAVRVPKATLERFFSDLFKAVPIPDDHADLVARLLVDTQIRGVYSHGLRQARRYLNAYQEGMLNTHPQTRVIKESTVTTALNGDRCLGFIVADEAIKITIKKAQAHGVAVATTTHHGHIGSSGKYVRQALRQGLVASCLAGRNLAFDDFYSDDEVVLKTMGDAPAVAFGLPTGDGLPDFLLDMAVSGFTDADELLERWPGILFKEMGMSHWANLMTGTLAGQTVDHTQIHDSQSGFYMVMDPKQFGGWETYLDNVNRLMRRVRGMTPLKGYDIASMAGGPEHDNESECERDGVPIWGDDREAMEEMGQRYEVPVPWAT